MKLSARSTVVRITSGSDSVSFSALICFVMMAGCSSKSLQTSGKTQGTKLPTAAETLPPVPTSPGVPLSAKVDIEGKAFSIDGSSVTARAVITTGECRRPVFVDANRVAFASRRASLERWQVFEADFSKKIERRVSFDAGDAEPVVAIGRRLVIASSSDERKSSDRLLNKYRGVFAAKEAAVAAAPSLIAGATPAPSVPEIPVAAPPMELPLQHLLLEHPASGRKGTEWLRMTHESAMGWSMSVDRDLKQALALMRSTPATEIFRVALSSRRNEPETRSWSPLKTELPVTGIAAAVDGRIMPDGKQIVWSNGSILWTTSLNGKDAKRLGDESIPAANDLTVDPSGQWIVFSSPTPTRGRNLMAIHKSGRCLKTLTELPGDETEPAFSPDGTNLLFTLRQGDISVIVEIPFGSPAAVAAACP